MQRFIKPDFTATLAQAKAYWSSGRRPKRKREHVDMRRRDNRVILGWIPPRFSDCGHNGYAYAWSRAFSLDTSMSTSKSPRRNETSVLLLFTLVLFASLLLVFLTTVLLSVRLCLCRNKTQAFSLHIPGEMQQTKLKQCVGQESNPVQLLGRQPCSPLYHRRCMSLTILICLEKVLHPFFSCFFSCFSLARCLLPTNVHELLTDILNGLYTIHFW